MCFWKRVFSVKWRSKLLIHNIYLTGHRKSACCPRLFVFMETWVITLFWHWRSQVFSMGYLHHDLKAFCESGHNNFIKNIIENMKWRWLVYYLSLLFFLFFERALKQRMVKSKIFRKLSLNFSFGQDSYLISDFAWPNSIKTILLQISLRFEIVFFKSKFAFIWKVSWSRWWFLFVAYHE